mmetsp:Transcript_35031/g.94944  ORF Transcript_35031/g.94944 Transcript_35031/m.94944 type:complete len:309 (-) Transcript_35031:4-930(-)
MEGQLPEVRSAPQVLVYDSLLQHPPVPEEALAQRRLVPQHDLRLHHPGVQVRGVTEPACRLVRSLDRKDRARVPLGEPHELLHGGCVLPELVVHHDVALEVYVPATLDRRNRPEDVHREVLDLPVEKLQPTWADPRVTVQEEHVGRVHGLRIPQRVRLPDLAVEAGRQNPHPHFCLHIRRDPRFVIDPQGGVPHKLGVRLVEVPDVGGREVVEVPALPGGHPAEGQARQRAPRVHRWPPVPRGQAQERPVGVHGAVRQESQYDGEERDNAGAPSADPSADAHGKRSACVAAATLCDYGRPGGCLCQMA